MKPEEIEEHIVQRTGKIDYRLIGKIIAQNHATIETHGDLSEACSQTFTIFQTKSGKYVCEKIMYFQIIGRPYVSEASLPAAISNISYFFGYCEQAKQLYRIADLKTLMAETIE